MPGPRGQQRAQTGRAADQQADVPDAGGAAVGVAVPLEPGGQGPEAGHRVEPARVTERLVEAEAERETAGGGQPVADD